LRNTIVLRVEVQELSKLLEVKADLVVQEWNKSLWSFKEE
jgi:hypothetical protein